jgi:hypothetical protein
VNVVERLVARAAWRRVEATLPALKRYGPLVGSTVLVAVVILRLLGYGEAAQAVESVGGVVGVTQQSPVGIGELTAAAATLTGIVLKFISVIRKSRAN